MSMRGRRAVREVITGAKLEVISTTLPVYTTANTRTRTTPTRCLSRITLTADSMSLVDSI